MELFKNILNAHLSGDPEQIQYVDAQMADRIEDATIPYIRIPHDYDKDTRCAHADAVWVDQSIEIYRRKRVAVKALYCNDCDTFVGEE